MLDNDQIDDLIISWVIETIIHECIHGEIDKVIMDFSSKDIELNFRNLDDKKYEERLINRIIGHTKREREREVNELGD